MITVESLVYTYPGQNTPTLKEVNFNINKGEIFGFLGPSGSKKSTTQKLLIGLLTDYQGKITIKEKDANQWGAEYYQEIGVDFELPNHFGKLTGLENLTLFCSFYGGKTRDPKQLLTGSGHITVLIP